MGQVIIYIFIAFDPVSSTVPQVNHTETRISQIQHTNQHCLSRFFPERVTPFMDLYGTPNHIYSVGCSPKLELKLPWHIFPLISHKPLKSTHPKFNPVNKWTQVHAFNHCFMAFVVNRTSNHLGEESRWLCSHHGGSSKLTATFTQ